jgi:hypothetical protein
MYNRLNKIINKIKSLGSTRWGRREVVDKILSAYMARDVQLPTLIKRRGASRNLLHRMGLEELKNILSPSRSQSFHNICPRCMSNLRRTRG